MNNTATFSNIYGPICSARRPTVKTETRTKERVILLRRIDPTSHTQNHFRTRTTATTTTDVVMANGSSTSGREIAILRHKNNNNDVVYDATAETRQSCESDLSVCLFVRLQSAWYVRSLSLRGSTLNLGNRQPSSVMGTPMASLLPPQLVTAVAVLPVAERLQTELMPTENR